LAADGGRARVKPRAEPEELARLRRLVGARLGLHLHEVNDVALGVALERCADAGAGGIGGFLERLASPSRARELEALAAELTVGETYFFREADQLRAFGDLARAEPGLERVLSAGCASGEEAYSLAMVTPDRPSLAIVGIDVHAAAIARARRGWYAEWALRQTPAGERARWFRQDGRGWMLDPTIRGRASFEVRNLADDAPDLWRTAVFDVVFLRNVIMYFSREQAAALVARVARALRPGGHLFLGHAESLRDLSDEFALHSSHGTFYYRRRSRTVMAPRAAERSLPSLPPPPHGLVPPAPPAPSPPAATPGGLEQALALLRQERFAEALDVVTELPSTVRRDHDVELLRAVLLTQQARLAEAGALCEALLAADERDPAAHYLLALLHEQAGELDAAVAEDRAAARFDPAFAMPHLHLGLLARRAGDRRLAQRALAEALRLLDGEDRTRLELFGGGFGREALRELCRSQLSAAKAEA